VAPKAQGTSTVASLHARSGDDAAPAADRGFFSFALWGRASATGAALLWRIRTDSAGPRAEHVQDLSDRSWLAHLKKSTDRTGTPPMLVRVVLHDRRRTGQPRGLPAVHHAAGPDEVSATELAATYRERWEIDLTFYELKTHQRGPRLVLRLQPALAARPSAASRINSTRHADCAPHPASSSARCPSGTSSAATTPTGPNPSTHPTT